MSLRRREARVSARLEGCIVGEEGGIGTLVLLVAQRAVGICHQVVVALWHVGQGYQIGMRQVVARVGQRLLPLCHGGEPQKGVGVFSPVSAVLK